jgi:hypothetical protein
VSSATSHGAFDLAFDLAFDSTLDLAFDSTLDRAFAFPFPYNGISSIICWL